MAHCHTRFFNLRTMNKDFVAKVEQELINGRSYNKPAIEKMAAAFGITDKTEIKELTELAIVNRARNIAQGIGTVKEKYDRIVALYYTQVNLSHRTSQSILLQQYSTPAPIGYLGGIFCGLDKLELNGGYGFEPSAGNGLLTIAGKPERIYVNEIDKIRNRNLKTQGFANVWNRDATKPFFDVAGTFSAVIFAFRAICNPDIPTNAGMARPIKMIIPLQFLSANSLDNLYIPPLNWLRELILKSTALNFVLSILHHFKLIGQQPISMALW